MLCLLHGIGELMTAHAQRRRQTILHSRKELYHDAEREICQVAPGLGCQASVGNSVKQEAEARRQDSNSRRRGFVPSIHAKELRYKWKISLWLSTLDKRGRGFRIDVQQATQRLPEH